MVFIITHPQENLYLLTSLLGHVQNQHSDLVNASRIGTCSWPHSTVSTDCVTACVRTSCRMNKKWLNHGTLNAWAGKLAIHLHLNWSFWWSPISKRSEEAACWTRFVRPGHIQECLTLQVMSINTLENSALTGLLYHLTKSIPALSSLGNSKPSLTNRSTPTNPP